MLNYFVNDKFKVLDCMYQSQLFINDKYVVKLSQQEIADTLRLTKPKVNAIISELKKDGYLIQFSPRGKYSLTQKAISELNSINCKEKK